MAQAMPLDALRRRAFTRALANGGAAVVRRERYGLYRVKSATRVGVWHTVSVVGRNWFCTCEAALSGKPCWHQAATYIAKVEAGGGRVSGPATPTEMVPMSAQTEQLPGNVTPLRRVA
jgi:hypothetical protein